MAELRLRVTEYDIVGITESWANHLITDAELAIPGFDMFRRDRDGRVGGGVVLYIRSTLKASVENNLTLSEFRDSVWCTTRLVS